MVLPCYAGPVEGRVDYQFNRTLAHSAAGQRRQKFTNKGADDQLVLIKFGFAAVSKLRPTHLNTSSFYIHAVKYICQGTNAQFVIYIIFTLSVFPDRLGCDERKT